MSLRTKGLWATQVDGEDRRRNAGRFCFLAGHIQFEKGREEQSSFDRGGGEPSSSLFYWNDGRNKGAFKTTTTKRGRRRRRDARRMEDDFPNNIYRVT